MQRLMKTFAGFLMLAAAATARAQQGPGGGGPPDGGPPDGGPPDPQQMREMMDQRVKRALGATDEVWATLQPLVEKVHELQHDVEGGAMMHPGPPRREDQDNNGNGGAGGGPGGDDPRPMSAVESAVADLKKVLSDATSSDEKVDAAVKVFEDAKKKTKVDLVDAQKQLTAAASHRQQAVLIALGLLE